MKLHMVHVRDIKSNCIGFTPMFVHHIGGAIRDFADQCKDKNTQVGKHPEDYELYHVGTWWDDGLGGYDIFKEPIQIGVGSNFKE